MQMQVVIESAGDKRTIDAPFRIGARMADLITLRDQLDAALMSERRYDLVWVSIAVSDRETSS